MGALASDGTLVVDRALMGDLGASEDYLEAEIAHQRQELEARAAGLRPWLVLPDLADRTVVLVDDGVATGSTVAAALQALRARGPRQLVLAVPVGPPDALRRLQALADRVEIVLAPEMVFGVGAWYQDFRQVPDTEVARLLAAASSAHDGPDAADGALDRPAIDAA